MGGVRWAAPPVLRETEEKQSAWEVGDPDPILMLISCGTLAITQLLCIFTCSSVKGVRTSETQFPSGKVYSFPQAAITNGHKGGGLKQ